MMPPNDPSIHGSTPPSSTQAPSTTQSTTGRMSFGSAMRTVKQGFDTLRKTTTHAFEVASNKLGIKNITGQLDSRKEIPLTPKGRQKELERLLEVAETALGATRGSGTGQIKTLMSTLEATRTHIKTLSKKPKDFQATKQRLEANIPGFTASPKERVALLKGQVALAKQRVEDIPEKQRTRQQNTLSTSLDRIFSDERLAKTSDSYGAFLQNQTVLAQQIDLAFPQKDPASTNA